MDLKIKYNAGTVVWAKTDKKYWPAIILSPNLIKKQTEENYQWVFWFGDYRVSMVKEKNIEKFTKFGDVFFKRKFDKKIKLGIIEALQVYGHPDTENMQEDELFQWAKVSLKSDYKNEAKALPECVLDKLRGLLDMENSPLKQIRNELSLQFIGNKNAEICLSCYSSNVIGIHPFFEGLICKYCRDKLISTFFNIGDDKIHFSCLICGNCEALLICSHEICGKGYCYNCIDNLASKKGRQDFLKKSFWACFICDTDDKEINGIIKARKNWNDNIYHIYNSRHFEIPRITGLKRKIRVLSLFDGISAGYTSLKQLNISVEAYYPSEIDYNCKNVTEKNYLGEITYLGDVRTITIETLKDICPIDLLIGGSPCNDLSLVNPRRRGLVDELGTGILFFEFYRILTELKLRNGKPFFWLFENVASMQDISKTFISSCFICEPVILNAGWTSPQNRERMYWGNCPSLKSNFVREGPNLQEYLTDGRIALFNKIQTITTNSNSLRQGPNNYKAVKDASGGHTDLLITEIEKIFGFDKNYTYFTGSSDSVRLALLGKSWSVQLTNSLFHFLKYYYLTEYEEQ